MDAMIDEILMELNRKINRIESKDENYKNNPKWIELRKQQDFVYKKLAERKLKYHEKQFKATNSPINKKFIRIYKEFINGKSEKDT